MYIQPKTGVFKCYEAKRDAERIRKRDEGRWGVLETCQHPRMTRSPTIYLPSNLGHYLYVFQIKDRTVLCCA